MRPSATFTAVLTLILLLSGCGKQPPGRRLYGPNCGICHHGGAGLPGEIPPLVDRLDVIAQTPEGRRYLADVMLNGLAGPIMANGEKYNFGMPSFRRLDDQQIALILNWLIARGETKPAPVMTPHDIAEARKHRLDPQSTHKERDQLSRIQPVP